MVRRLMMRSCLWSCGRPIFNRRFTQINADLEERDFMETVTHIVDGVAYEVKVKDLVENEIRELQRKFRAREVNYRKRCDEVHHRLTVQLRGVVEEQVINRVIETATANMLAKANAFDEAAEMINDLLSERGKNERKS